MHAYLVHVYIYAHINMQLYLTYWTSSLILRMVSPSKHVTGKEKKKYCGDLQMWKEKGSGDLMQAYCREAQKQFILTHWRQKWWSVPFCLWFPADLLLGFSSYQ